jgi:hypothetical protein
VGADEGSETSGGAHSALCGPLVKGTVVSTAAWAPSECAGARQRCRLELAATLTTTMLVSGRTGLSSGESARALRFLPIDAI